MNAIQILTALAAKVADEMPKVRNEFRTLDKATALMRAKGAHSIEEAFYMEAKRRALADMGAAS